MQKKEMEGNEMSHIKKHIDYATGKMLKMLKE